MLRKFILCAIVATAAMSATANTTVKNDTIPVENVRIEKVIIDETTNSKGCPVTKYYVLYDKQLISTSKSVAEYYQLCQTHGAECPLAIVINTKTNRKRIIRK